MGGASAPTLSAPIAATLIATGSKGIGAEAPPTKNGGRCARPPVRWGRTAA
ncbi:DUF6053 domain-containing protein [Lysobacter enzymogenes]|uniref:DUF6053 domain-containing protein n=1 Tax=Lysobacter enzymogenes TaxID=69 RepID=UPI003D2F9714